LPDGQVILFDVDDPAVLLWSGCVAVVMCCDVIVGYGRVGYSSGHTRPRRHNKAVAI
jgi:hypothetical protein